jgi:hypothetical protein
MPSANWRSPDDYVYLNELTGLELAWEFCDATPSTSAIIGGYFHSWAPKLLPP